MDGRRTDGDRLQTPGEHSYSAALLEAEMDRGFERRSEEHVKEIFDRYRSADTFDITKADLLGALQALGISESDSEVALKAYEDMDRVDWPEFCLIVTRIGKLEQWTRTLPLANLLADCMPVKSHANPVEAATRLSDDDLEVIVACFSKGLKRLLKEELSKLPRACNVRDSSPRAETRKMQGGNINDFHNGLNRRVGDPHLDFFNAMKAEHDNKDTFKTEKHGIETSAYKEWQIAVNDTGVELNEKDKAHDRRFPNITELCRTPLAVTAHLSREEVIAVVLGTGPMYERYTRNPHKYVHKYRVYRSCIQGATEYKKLPVSCIGLVLRT